MLIFSKQLQNIGSNLTLELEIFLFTIDSPSLKIREQKERHKIYDGTVKL